MGSSVLTAELAREIAAQTTRIIDYNGLITDGEAVVIGSGDPDRLGSVHEASVEVLATGVAAGHDSAQARALIGVLPGITVPIVLDGAVIGTVGITGPPARVARIGQLVQRQTEILLRESLYQRTRLLRENRLAQLVRDIALFDPRVVDEQILLAGAAELGYDLAHERVAIVFEVQPGAARPPSTVRAIAEIFDARADVVAELAVRRYAVLHHPSAGRTGSVAGRGRRAAELLRRRYEIVVHAGIGGPGSGVAGIADSLADASAALRLGSPRSGADVAVVDIADLRIRQLLDAAGHVARDRFADAQPARLVNESDYAALRDSLIRDVRDPKIAVAMYLACLL